MTSDHIEKVYSRYAKIYDLVWGRVWTHGREVGLQLLDLSPGDKVLEIGVGTGLSLPTVSRGVEITGIDLSEAMLRKAQQRVEESGCRNNVRLLKMDATRLEFPDNTFDRVYAAYFISTVPSPVDVLREMKRVCRPGGYVVLINHFASEHPVLRALERAVSPLCTRLGFRTDLNLPDLMAQAGLTIDSIERTDLFGQWRAVRCCNPAKAA
jgi:phosphatidylethanolamine/phosphatidyl-N-methylethanolamine N-methyltransferase